MFALVSLSLLECNLKKFKSRHKTPTATVSKIPPNVVPTGLVAHEPQDQGMVAGAEGGYGAP